jgi:hypothetical protein
MIIITTKHKSSRGERKVGTRFRNRKSVASSNQIEEVQTLTSPEHSGPNSR